MHFVTFFESAQSKMSHEQYPCARLTKIATLCPLPKNICVLINWSQYNICPLFQGEVYSLHMYMKCIGLFHTLLISCVPNCLFYGAILFRIGQLFGSVSYRLYSSVVSYSTVMLTICYKTVNEKKILKCIIWRLGLLIFNTLSALQCN